MNNIFKLQIHFILLSFSVANSFDVKDEYCTINVAYSHENTGFAELKNFKNHCEERYDVQPPCFCHLTSVIFSFATACKVYLKLYENDECADGLEKAKEMYEYILVCKHYCECELGKNLDKYINDLGKKLKIDLREKEFKDIAEKLGLSNKVIYGKDRPERIPEYINEYRYITTA